MQRIRESFDRQGLMRTLGAELESVDSGTVTITCGFREGLTQQHGLFRRPMPSTTAGPALTELPAPNCQRISPVAASSANIWFWLASLAIDDA